jgi:hypothetical protein
MYYLVDKDTGTIYSGANTLSDEAINGGMCFASQKGLKNCEWLEYTGEGNPIYVNGNLEANTQENLEDKYIRLRDIRDKLMRNTMWYAERHNLEKQALQLSSVLSPEEYANFLALNGMSELPITTTTLTEVQFAQCMLWWAYMRNLPAITDLNSIPIDNIIESNTALFPPFPFSTELN